MTKKGYKTGTVKSTRDRVHSVREPCTTLVRTFRIRTPYHLRDRALDGVCPSFATPHAAGEDEPDAKIPTETRAADLKRHSVERSSAHEISP